MPVDHPAGPRGARCFLGLQECNPYVRLQWRLNRRCKSSRPDPLWFAADRNRVPARGGGEHLEAEEQSEG